MKLLTINNAQKGVLLTLKLFGFLFTAFLDIVFGDPDEYDEDEVSGAVSPNLDHSLSTAAGRPASFDNVNNFHNIDRRS